MLKRLVNSKLLSVPLRDLLIRGCSAACITPALVFAQTSPPPLGPAASMIIPADPKTEAAMRSMEAQRRAFASYQKCVAEHRREVDLHNAAADVIRYRDMRPVMERALKRDPHAAAQYPGGVDQVLAIHFARYKSLGGTAESISEVQPVATPCEVPGQLPPLLGSGTSPPVLIRDSQRVVVPSQAK